MWEDERGGGADGRVRQGRHTRLQGRPPTVQGPHKARLRAAHEEWEEEVREKVPGQGEEGPEPQGVLSFSRDPGRVAVNRHTHTMLARGNGLPCVHQLQSRHDALGDDDMSASLRDGLRPD